ncbi:hypothetical protein FNF27_07851 [Cafeteria roenbergensis]|uniref:RRM domain-containing protein n=1 Tax=Cafeteria roenbergensis TaxID=33653 RepID=A0A5A8CAA5_CAFRO|nr:hypothetical protein FNF29_05493 [Cafeteria roenbergensis]KAA0164133.1 hypothetical protein FNF27_07851 [Cafeteria roenbergensis]|eukprot:KAA0150052.1 hypothetical protein FNF29_05493 [Cafeteria roenbergensis]
MADAVKRAKKRPRDEAAAAAAAEVPEDERTAYVEGMPYESTEDELRAFFAGEGADGAAAEGAEDGGVESIRMPRYQDTGRCMGYAHVVFRTKDDLERGLGRDGAYLGSRFLAVSRAKARRPDAGAKLPSRARPSNCSTLFVRNLPYSADEDAIRLAFMRFGKVASIRLPRWGNTNNSKGIAYVQFLKGESASAAVAAATTEPMVMEGRALGLDYDTGAPKASFKGADGRAWAKTEGKDLRKKGVLAPASRAGAKKSGWESVDAAAAAGGAGRDGAADEGRAPRRKRRSRKGGDE